MGHFQTGGGQFTPKSDDIDLKIVGALKDQFQPDENHFDSSAIIYDEVVPVVNDTDTPEASCVCIITEEPHAEIVTLPEDAATSSDIAPPQDMPSRSKRKSSLDIVSETLVKRKQEKTDYYNIQTSLKKRELEFKEIEHKNRCDIMEMEKIIKLKQLEREDLEKKIKLKQLEREEYECKIKELEYKMKLKHFQME